MSRFSRSWSLLSLVLAFGCGSEATGVTILRCTAGGTSPPTDCALVQAVARDATGNVLPFLDVKVDSVLGQLGYAYRSGTAVTAGDGGFTLLVFRINRFQQPATPDTATVEVKGYDGTTPISRAKLVMRFFPLGEVLTPTSGTASFVAYP
ncbi:MAG TPA: hypothetical protein VF187_06430 [Gemmatimonadales bacterium]